MQLATSQRPHPPPVPPRPSRQVVAEALKRSPRPPCPTRQAPPPPNTRPWRSEEKENPKLSKVGRTVVYESGTDNLTNGQHKRSSLNDQLVRPLASPRCSNDETIASSASSNITGNTVAEKTVERGDGGPSRETSERNKAENQRERQQQQQQRPQLSSNGNERCDWENSTQLSGDDNEIGNIDRRSTISCDKVLVNEKSAYFIEASNVIENKNKKDFERDAKGEESCEGQNIKNPTGCPNPVIRENVGTTISRSCSESLRNSDQVYKRPLDGSVNENIAKSAEGERTEICGDDVGKSERRSSSFGNKSDCQGEATTGKRLSTTPTKIEKVSNNNGKVVGSRDENGETISRGEEEDEEEEEAVAAKSGSTTTISSDDCATVVVIDEPERKIAFNEDNDNIHHQDWLEAGVRYSSTKITLPGDDPADRPDEFEDLDDNRQRYDDDDDIRRAYAELDFSSIRERIAMSSLQGLPPLPRSLSGFNLSEGRREACEPPPPPARSSSKTPKNVKSTQPSSSRPSPPGRQLTTLDTQLAILRKEMFGLRQLDLSLLSQLWSLNESIQEFRQLLQEQEDRAPSPSPSSEEGDDNSYGSHPPPPPRRPAPLLHHHRPPRPPRPLRPPASDDSPSSEEYGAV